MTPKIEATLPRQLISSFDMLADVPPKGDPHFKRIAEANQNSFEKLAKYKLAHDSQHIIKPAKIKKFIPLQMARSRSITKPQRLR